MEKPLVTIAISTYNRASSLQQCSLPAIEKLTYPHYEVVIIDDHSTDATQTVLQDYQKTFPLLHVFRNEKNRGLPCSRNRAIAHAQGSLIVFTDDDVSLFPDCLDEFVMFYAEHPDVMFAWGCVYQCHGSHDRNKPTFGTGSLFSIRRSVADYIQFDTNIRYFKTYGCEEHDFARRVQQHFSVVFAKTARANHYQAPARDRSWRGLGGDLNFLYEKTKSGSLLSYYTCLIWSVPLAIKRLITHQEFDDQVGQHPYKSALQTAHLLLVFIKKGETAIALKWLFYVLIDIPVRAKIKSRVESIRAGEIVGDRSLAKS